MKLHPDSRSEGASHLRISGPTQDQKDEQDPEKNQGTKVFNGWLVFFLEFVPLVEILKANH